MTNPEHEERLSPEGWGQRGGLQMDGGHWSPEFAAASTLYGWARHSYHFVNDPLLLTEQQFGAAMSAAREFPNKKPYALALSPLVKSRKEKKKNA